MTDQQIPPLLPCPFCGMAASLSQASDDPRYGHDVCCTVCLGSIHCTSANPVNATRQWNTRPVSSPGPSDEAVRDAVRDLRQYWDDLQGAPNGNRVGLGFLKERLKGLPALLSRIDSAPVTFREGPELEQEMAAALEPDLLPGLRRALEKSDEAERKSRQQGYSDFEWFKKLIRHEIAAQGEADE